MSNDVVTMSPLNGPLSGTARVPGDKSISHRAVLFSAMAEGTSHISGVLDSHDVRSSIAAVRALGADVVYNHADYRLMSRRALDALAEYKEVNLFLRGLVPLVGYPSTVVYYERGKRFAGESKYPLRKMLSFAWEGVSSLTVSPLRLITRIGIVMFLVSIAMLIYFLVRYFTGHTVAGWSSLAVSIWAIGVVGEYIGKIYLETKARPRYRIETELDDREAEL